MADGANLKAQRLLICDCVKQLSVIGDCSLSSGIAMHSKCMTATKTTDSYFTCSKCCQKASSFVKDVASCLLCPHIQCCHRGPCARSAMRSQAHMQLEMYCVKAL